MKWRGGFSFQFVFDDGEEFIFARPWQHRMGWKYQRFHGKKIIQLMIKTDPATIHLFIYSLFNFQRLHQQSGPRAFGKLKFKIYIFWKKIVKLTAS